MLSWQSFGSSPWYFEAVRRQRVCVVICSGPSGSVDGKQFFVLFERDLFLPPGAVTFLRSRGAPFSVTAVRLDSKLAAPGLRGQPRVGTVYVVVLARDAVAQHSLWVLTLAARHAYLRRLWRKLETDAWAAPSEVVAGSRGSVVLKSPTDVL